MPIREISNKDRSIEVSKVVALKIPREMIEARVSLGHAGHSEHARVENTDYGLCPLCKNEMKVSSANGIPVHVCLKDRHVSAMRDGA
jgi:hypothetical protein